MGRLGEAALPILSTSKQGFLTKKQRVGFGDVCKDEFENEIINAIKPGSTNKFTEIEDMVRLAQ